jgi:hypothetical protein
MDDSGRMYASKEHRERLREMLGESVDVEPIEGAPDSALAIEDEWIAKRLANMPRRARRAFMSERRRGATESAALASAEAAMTGDPEG